MTASTAPPEYSEIRSDKAQICREILKTLPQWFGIEEALERYAVESDGLPMYGCRVGEQVAGIVTLKPHTPVAVEIHVIAVRPTWHRRGIGGGLIDRARTHARARGVKYLTVKTLSPERDDPNYAKTRAFYAAMNFEPIETFPTLWGPENPALLMIRTVAP